MSKYRHRINALLLEIKNGDISKVAELYEETYNHLIVIALINLNNKNDSEDVLHETYCRVIEYIHSFNALKDGYNWLCRIVQNVARDFNKRAGKYVLFDELPFDFSSGFDESAKILDKNVLLKLVNKFT